MPNEFDTLPPELVLEIMQFLPPNALNASARVNKNWHSFLQDDYFWRRQIHYYFPDHQISTKVNALTQFKSLYANKIFYQTEGRKIFYYGKKKAACSMLFHLVKAGDLAAIIKLKDQFFPKLSWEHLFTNIYDQWHINLLGWAVKHKHRHIIAHLFQETIKEVSVEWQPYYAARFNHTEFLQPWVKSHAAIIDHPTPSGKTLLETALVFNQEEALTILLEAGANPNLASGALTPLASAAKFGHLQALNVLIKYGARVNDRNSDFPIETALMFAASEGHESCIEALLKAGVDVSLVNGMQKSASMYALMYGKIKCYELLMKHCGPINYKTDAWQNVLGTAVIGKQDESVKILLAQGVFQPDHPRAIQLLTNAVTMDTNSILKLLIKAGGDANTIVGQGGESILHLAALRNHTSCVRTLLKAGAFPNTLGWLNFTPLMIAASLGNIGALRLLIKALKKAGLDLDTQNEQHQTALKLAIEADKTKCVKALVLAGANISKTLAIIDKNQQPQTWNLLKMLELLQHPPENQSVQHLAVQLFNHLLRFSGINPEGGFFEYPLLSSLKQMAHFTLEHFREWQREHQPVLSGIDQSYLSMVTNKISTLLQHEVRLEYRHLFELSN